MKTTFYIVLNMKTAGGFESYGRFFIGNDRDFAYSLFSSLKGTEAVRETDVLHMDLVETIDDLPVNVKVINCTLDELSVNCRIISKEVFRLLNLDEMGS
jgi:hypothetical protein